MHCFTNGAVLHTIIYKVDDKKFISQQKLL